MPRKTKLELTGICFLLQNEALDLSDLTEEELQEVLKGYTPEQLIKCISVYNDAVYAKLILR